MLRRNNNNNNNAKKFAPRSVSNTARRETAVFNDDGDDKRRKQEERHWGDDLFRRRLWTTSSVTRATRLRFRSLKRSKYRWFLKTALLVVVVVVVVTIISILLIILLYKDWLGFWVDHLLWQLVVRSIRLPPLACPSSLVIFQNDDNNNNNKNVIKDWPTVEMRNRKSIADYRNEYLAAVLSRKNVSLASRKPQRDTPTHYELVGVAPADNNASSMEEFERSWWEEHAFRARLEREGCRPSWWCDRCLSYPTTGGSLSNCQSICPPCWKQILQETRNISLPQVPVDWKEVAVGVTDTKNAEAAAVDEMHPTNQETETRQIIPRIIHAVGQFENQLPTVLSHPEWIRAQNAMRAQHKYEYHPYPTVSLQRQWIQQNYRHPTSAFLTTFDILNGDARQREFFSLLVLFRQGGIVIDSK